ncbi:hypothetical protein B0O99DRAFT_691267 [Bisporella sp. PMI_857]|nr:hypothetical protein B0O99DRAFT_691267 [Bisporella sp. PMI_857]
MALLEPYFRVALGSHYGEQDPIFAASIKPPTLEYGRKNRIITYFCTMNPPHRRHHLLLRHAFQSVSEHLNIIAAMIFPLMDAFVDNKSARKSKDSLKFCIKDRIQLWRAGQEPGDDEWGFLDERSGNEYSGLNLRTRLNNAISADGFDFGYIRLAGPDYMTIAKNNLQKTKYDDVEWITNNISRETEFWVPRQVPLRLKSADDWEAEGKMATARGKMVTRSSARVAKSRAAPSKTGKISKNRIGKTIWSCRSLIPRHKSKLYFVPAKMEREYSSTEVREVLMKEISDEERTEALRPLVRNPEVLLKLLDRHLCPFKRLFC